jgi:adenosylmethionine-8-amino-7-oxononanoate aminotransferase
MSYLQKDLTYVWHPFTQAQTAPEPIVVLRAKDATLYTESHGELLDCNSSWWVNTHGHSNEQIVNAIIEQASTLDHCIFAGATHPKAIEVSERIIDKLGAPFQKVFFSDNGSTAVEVAIKMAIQYWKNNNQPKTNFLALDGAYHGDTFGAMSLGQRGYFNEPFEKLFFDVDFLDFPTDLNYKAILENAEVLMSSNTYAAIILEPLIQGSAGMRVYSIEFLEALVEIAKKNNVIVIFDEVMTAFGRTGKLFAFEHTTVKPDIICLSKGLTGGVLPLGLTVSTQKIYDAFLAEDKTKALLHGHSFTGNAISCAVACASLDLFNQAATWEKILKITERNIDFVKKHKNVKGISPMNGLRSFGTILAIDLQVNDGQNDYFSSISSEITPYFIQKGLFIRPLGNTIFINPPYCLTEAEQNTIFATLLSFLQDKYDH